MGDAKRERYDVTIIGGGAGGYTAALEATANGLKVALIEKDRVGGTCLNRGCVPTQCLLRDLIEYSFLKTCDTIERGSEGVRLNLQKIMDRKNRVVDELVSGTERSLLSQGVTIFRGEAAFSDPQTVVVGPSQEVIQSKHVILATGSRWRLDPPLAFDHEHVWDTTDALQIEAVPKTIAILGAGFRTMTFADIFHYLGSDVHIISPSERILPDIDRGIASRYRKVLRDKNIHLRTKTTVTEVRAGAKGDSIELALEAKKGNESVRVEKILVPGDREANAQGLDLEKIGLSLKNGLVPVDHDLMTPISGVYAIGDVIGGKYAAHKAMLEGAAVAKGLSGGKAAIRYEMVPLCLYTNPEVACIGLTEEEAQGAGREIEIGYFSFAAGSRPVIFDQAEGIIKVIAERKYGEVLGVHMIGPQVAELISLASMAMKNELSLKEIAEVVYPHPSFSESFLEAIKDALRMVSSA